MGSELDWRRETGWDEDGGRVWVEMGLGGRYVGEEYGFGEETGLGKRDGLKRGGFGKGDGLGKEIGFGREMV